MGRIKTKNVKNASKQLIAKEHSFTDNFEHNKVLITGFMPSKPIRNKVAGYLARLIRLQNTPKRPPKEKNPEPLDYSDQY